MRRQGGGTIVNVSSIVGKFPQPLGGGYTATKYALQGASGAARAELKRDNVDLILVCPGLTETEFSQNSRISVRGAEHRQGERHSLGRGVEPDRVGRRTVKAIKRGEREVYITLFDRLLVLVATLFPGLLQVGADLCDPVQKKAIRRGWIPRRMTISVRASLKQLVPRPSPLCQTCRNSTHMGLWPTSYTPSGASEPLSGSIAYVAALPVPCPAARR